MTSGMGASCCSHRHSTKILNLIKPNSLKVCRRAETLLAYRLQDSTFEGQDEVVRLRKVTQRIRPEDLKQSILTTLGYLCRSNAMPTCHALSKPCARTGTATKSAEADPPTGPLQLGREQLLPRRLHLHACGVVGEGDLL